MIYIIRLLKLQMITFVTALINLQEDRPNEKTIDTYISLLETLQSTGIRIHLFTSPDLAQSLHVKNGIVESIRLSDLDTYASSPNGLPEHRNPNKDTRNYLILMNSKLELVKRAIESGHHSSSHYAWIDVGISHILKTPQETIQALQSKQIRKECLYIPGCLHHSFQGFDAICWRFCGGFFLGDASSILSFYSTFSREYPHLPKLSWEVNVWAYLESKGLHIDWFSADHNDSMLQIPAYEPILRHTHIHVYWYGYMSGCHVGGHMERFVSKCIQDLGNPTQVVFPLTDGFQPHDDTLLRKLESLSDTQPIVVTLCTRNYSRKNLLYLPLDDDTFEHGLAAMMTQFHIPKWEERHPIAFWRGMTNGTGRPLLRTRVVEELFTYRHADVKAIPHNERPEDPPKFMFDTHRKSIQDHLQYKYLLIVDGGLIASSHQWMFGSGAVPIMITHPENEYWFKRFLRPMVDYVPIQYNLSDLKEKIDWLVKNDDNAKRIAENAMNFARRVFSPEFQKRYVREEIQRLVAYKHTFGIAIPCYSLHKHYIRRCLDLIEAQTVKPTKVVISCSSTTEVERIDTPYSFSYQIIPVAHKQNPAQNRNTAASYLDTDIVSFFDVDDVMHPQRIEFILQCFTKPCDIVLHSFEDGTSFSTLNYSHATIRHNVLRQAPSGCAVVHDNVPSKIHHAHVTVRREVYETVKFHEQLAYDRIDDAVFCGDVLSLPNIRSAYIENPLSCYVSSGLASE